MNHQIGLTLPAKEICLVEKPIRGNYVKMSNIYLENPAVSQLNLGGKLSLNGGSYARQAQASNPASVISPAQQDFWEFVSCGKCHLPFVNDGAADGSAGGPTIPFWLTECGHILCNQHLSTCFFYISSRNRYGGC